ncbi:cytochrome aa3 quinol oxidase subunit IV [Lysinibacillus odysseyi]|uniref:Quinol oxidase subunit 4 n=1 Tax=Lysinibacillus odysseyi 34hs-1 = NBRC 100172 TaxID=1220589 RepID=A0A0A3J6G0_9BACI|nr:cytochrome aa3 quinol oxidase subunit IV [Lysinibacillus odysseyi]KGR82662.1 cytochrome aa3 quinol oxidase subunit IV [Lysinibacillus odysseyi 34hs-1 = NBRC 100172]
MAKYFPLGQVMGFVFSLILTGLALLVHFTDMSMKTGMIVLLVTAFLQAGLQFAIFMHAGETKDKWSIYSNIVYGFAMVIITILGTLLILLWDM